MSKSTQSSLSSKGKDMELLKEEAKSLNSFLEKTRLELTTSFIEASCEADITKKLQKEAECKGYLEELQKLIRE